MTVAQLRPSGRPEWLGLWLTSSGVRSIGPRPPASLLTTAGHLTGATALLVDLVQASARASTDALETLAGAVDEAEGRSEAPAVPELAALQRSVAHVRRQVLRLAVLVTDLEGPLGTRFPGVAGPIATLRAEADQLETFSGGLAQAVRDLVAIRTAAESNRLAESANELGRVSNRIAALANTSNLRMLGVAYVALLLALVSAVVLIPNTAATILGMPSAAWVPGLWVDVILVVLAAIPVAVVFSRPWVRRMLRQWSSYEDRSAEGVADLPEVPAQEVDRPAAAERLIRQGP